MPYTYETFRNFLEFEILQSASEQMGWNDVPGPVYTQVGTVNFPTSITGPKDAQPVYDSITNETLLRLGYSTPEDVPDEKLAEFRALGRCEAWRAVAYNTLADTNVNLGEAALQRSSVFNNALQQIQIAEDEYNSVFGSSTPTVKSPRANSYSGQVTVRW